MATEKQIAANRANALKSTGPRTPAGKARSARNSFAAALVTKELLSPYETRDTLDHHAAQLREHYAPSTPVEALLVDRLIAASWRLRRIRIQETRAYHQCANTTEIAMPKGAITSRPIVEVVAQSIEERVVDRLSIHEGRIERSFYRALRELHQQMKNRKSANEATSKSIQSSEMSKDGPEMPPPRTNPMQPN